MRMKLRRITIASLVLFLAVCYSACVDQSQGQTESQSTEQSDEKQSEKKVLATSVATVEICEKLGIELSGIPSSEIYDMPKVYQDLPVIGTAMAPDMEIVASLNPDFILSPVSLISDLQPKYDALDTEYAFLNLSSVAGMYKSIMELGVLFDKEEEADKLVEEFETFYQQYQKEYEEKEAPTVLILMGLPGSYVAATEQSYVGSLVMMAGGKNVYTDETKDFINVNTEDMLTKDPDIILRTAHAMPDDVTQMFAEEFETNDIWKRFRAVKEGRVYDLTPGNFGMSANFSYPEALEELADILYN